ncbi:MAG: TatD family hydrolase [Candidatus Thermoplasmatota archaeon]
MMEILDNHLHLQPHGEFLNAARRFERAGGTRLIVAHMPYHDLPVTKSFDFSEGFRRTISIAEEVERRTGLWCRAVIGPYPVEMVRLCETLPLERAKELMLEGMDEAAEFVEEGRALGLGEIGRPHFDVAPEVLDASNEVLMHGMRTARVLDCAVVLHTESATPGVMRELAEMADRAGLQRERVIKHFSPPLASHELNHGLTISLLATTSNLTEALRQGGQFLMETDYLDDPRRPGAVLGVETVPRRTKEMLRKGLMTKEQAQIIHEETPRRAYGQRYEER